ncbi:BamA/TamA family outer membrane protein [Paraburkholderia caribensis]|uniref:Glyceraldehyde-3-phosphate dehydrogenase n=2 Tax=Paraburkholderia caribensis TaxID=75105 RepID=A0A9Q6S9Q8_9BURK|nr:glyceraldehyde-3-phosphate dehydrogenase [Paraburkholderia caribensis]
MRRSQAFISGLTFIVMVIVAAIPFDARAGDQSPRFVDPEDGALDMSDFLLKHKGALPVPIVITEPAIGYGLGLGLLFFSGPVGERKDATDDSSFSRAPPNVTALGGLYTNNGTWAAAAAHFHTWDNDRYRYLGALAKVDAHLNYFGASNAPRAYTLQGAAVLQQLLMRLGDSRWYAGLRYLFFDSSSSFASGVPGDLPGLQKDLRIGSVSVVVDYDSRDNIFFPAAGSFAELEAQLSRTAFGGTQDYDVYAARGYTWLPLTRALILGLRVDGKFSSGDIPFFAQPYVELRGVQKGRYQDRNAVAAEIELRWDLTPRWSLLGFTGAGKAYGRWHSFADAPNVQSVGAGFRYLIARALGVSIGLDVAHSRDQNAFYIQVGSAWR